MAESICMNKPPIFDYHVSSMQTREGLPHGTVLHTQYSLEHCPSASVTYLRGSGHLQGPWRQTPSSCVCIEKGVLSWKSEASLESPETPDETAQRPHKLGALDPDRSALLRRHGRTAWSAGPASETKAGWRLETTSLPDCVRYVRRFAIFQPVPHTQRGHCSASARHNSAAGSDSWLMTWRIASVPRTSLANEAGM